MIEKLNTIPSISILKKEEPAFDYIDSFQSIISENIGHMNIINVGNIFLSASPRWADRLMTIRNKVVKVFGLKTPDNFSENQKQGTPATFEPGEQAGIFKSFTKLKNEIILGADDKHLNFRVSLLLEAVAYNQTKLCISTVVKYNNLFGRLYFLPVKPFHRLILLEGLKNMIDKIEMEDNRRIE